MKKAIIATFAACASCMCFATQGEVEIPEKTNAIIEQGNPSDDETGTVPPVLEKCKKKKK
jgi:hypothetical protein